MRQTLVAFAASALCAAAARATPCDATTTSVDANTYRVLEGDVLYVPAGKAANFCSLTTCMTFTVLLSDGAKIVAHAAASEGGTKVAGRDYTELPAHAGYRGVHSEQILAKIKALFDAKKGRSALAIRQVLVGGIAGLWNIEADGKMSGLSRSRAHPMEDPSKSKMTKAARAAVRTALGGGAFKVSSTITNDEAIHYAAVDDYLIFGRKGGKCYAGPALNAKSTPHAYRPTSDYLGLSILDSDDEDNGRDVWSVSTVAHANGCAIVITKH